MPGNIRERFLENAKNCHGDLGGQRREGLRGLQATNHTLPLLEPQSLLLDDG